MPIRCTVTSPRSSDNMPGRISPWPVAIPPPFLYHKNDELPGNDQRKAAISFNGVPYPDPHYMLLRFINSAPLQSGAGFRITAFNLDGKSLVNLTNNVTSTSGYQQQYPRSLPAVAAKDVLHPLEKVTAGISTSVVTITIVRHNNIFLFHRVVASSEFS